VAPGTRLRIAELDSNTVIDLDKRGIFSLLGPNALATYTPSSVQPVKVSVTTRSAIANGDFGSGQWGPVADCNAIPATESIANLDGQLLSSGSPNGRAALELSASYDSACEGQTLAWHDGPLVLNLMVRRVQGSAPRICLWQTGPNRCARLPTLPDAPNWSQFRSSVKPEPGTTSLTLYLYADGDGPRSRTVIDYADIRVLETSALPTVALLQDPTSQTLRSVDLAVVHSGFSTAWRASPRGEHVLVDGLLNGWLLPLGSDHFSASYEGADLFHAAQWISLLALPICAVFVIWPMGARRVRRMLFWLRLKKSR